MACGSVRRASNARGHHVERRATVAHPGSARRSPPEKKCAQVVFADEREKPVIVKNLEKDPGRRTGCHAFVDKVRPGSCRQDYDELRAAQWHRRRETTQRCDYLHLTGSLCLRLDAGLVDRSRTEPRCRVRDLKAFFDYAQRGSVALSTSGEASLGPAESFFEEAVAEALHAGGWEVRAQIGVSDFRIDIGVVHPDFAGRFISGIECDGARYHSSATARYRDKVRKSVLEGLGWRILRVWSTDWFRNSSDVVEPLWHELEGILNDDRKCGAKAADKADEHAAEAVSLRKSRDEPDLIQLPSPQPAGTEATEDDAATADEGKTLRLVAGTHRAPGKGLPTDTEAGGEDFGNAQRGHITPDPNRFFDEQFALILRRLTRRMVDREGPIPLHVLARRVAQQHGWHRTGKRIQAQVRSNISLVDCYREFDTDFIWASGSHSDRTPFRGLNGRSIGDTSRTEIMSVIDAHARVLVNELDPVLNMSRRLGIMRLSKNARAYLSDCAR